jgi:hypothetical protein
LQVFFRPLNMFLAQLLHTIRHSAPLTKGRRFVDRVSPHQPTPAVAKQRQPYLPLTGDAMTPTAQHTPEATRQFLEAMCAKANNQLLAQGLVAAPHLAVAAQANLDLATVLDLLRD